MRKSRELQNDAEYHVTAKINRGEFILESDEIKDLFLQIVLRAKKKYSFQIRGFTIMDNHVHFLMKPGKEDCLSRIMQWILSVFAIYYNKMYNLKGHVWHDRFKSKVIKSFRQLIATFKYICDNPVKADMVKDPQKYLYGTLWFIHQKRFDFVERPDFILQLSLPEYF